MKNTVKDNKENPRDKSSDLSDYSSDSSDYSSQESEDEKNQKSSLKLGSEEIAESQEARLKRHILKQIYTNDAKNKLDDLLNRKSFNPSFLNDVFERNSSSTTIFIEAVKSGNIKIVNSLIQKSADVKVATKDTNPLLSALTSRPINKNIVQILVDNGADVNNCPGSNRPLFYALSEGNEEVAQILVAKGARITENQKSDNNFAVQGDEKFDLTKVNNPLIFLAIHQNMPNLLEMAVKNQQENLNCHDINGEPPIYSAISTRNHKIINFLISQPNCLYHPKPNSEASNIFESCVSYKNFELAKFLAKNNKAEIDSRIGSARQNILTPLELFALEGSIESRNFIKEFTNFSDEEFDKFSDFAAKKYILNFSYSLKNTATFTKNENLDVAKIVKRIVEKSQAENDIKIDDSIILSLEVIALNKKLEIGEKKVGAIKLPIFSHSAYAVIEGDEKGVVKKFSYCDGNCIAKLVEGERGHSHGFGVLTFEIDSDKNINLEFFDNFRISASSLYQNDGKQLFDIMRKVAICDENNNPIYSKILLLLDKKEEIVA